MFYVYVIAPASEAGNVKIGHSNDVRRRLGELQTGHPEKLKIFFKKELPSEAKAVLLEQSVQQRLATRRQTGEWFDVSVETATTMIEEVAIGKHLDPVASAARLADLVQRKAKIDAENTILTAKLVAARATLDEIRTVWEKNLKEWTEVQAEIERLTL